MSNNSNAAQISQQKTSLSKRVDIYNFFGNFIKAFGCQYIAHKLLEISSTEKVLCRRQFPFCSVKFF